MRRMGLEGLAPGPSTSCPAPEHRVYPYLLRDLEIVRPESGSGHRHHLCVDAEGVHVPGSDHGLVQSLRAGVGVVEYPPGYRFLPGDAGDGVERAAPRDLQQRPRRTVHRRLEQARVRISMDGRGRVFDNIFAERLWRTLKYEDIYLKDYQSVIELLQGLTDYFEFYNHKRPHQGLGYRTPVAVYQAKSVIKRASRLS